jgi:hypothetical protein
MKLNEIVRQILEAHLDDGFITEVDFDSIVAEIMILHEQAIADEIEKREILKDLNG